MPRIINRNPAPSRNYFLVDACFLANKFIPKNRASNSKERKRIELCDHWWEEIDTQLKKDLARVFVPDICIAESFKVLAKKYFKDRWFKSSQDFNYWRSQLRSTISISKTELYKADRRIRFHDVESNRDIIIAVDRFYESFFKHGKNVQLPDLIVVATAKYLIDFFDIPKDLLHIVTMDRQLRDGSKKIPELPNAYDPTIDLRDRIFQ